LSTKSVDVHFEIAGQVVMLQQNAILERLMPTLNLALCHRMIGRADQESAAQSPAGLLGWRGFSLRAAT
jgi:hypothetical protein